MNIYRVLVTTNERTYAANVASESDATIVADVTELDAHAGENTFDVTVINSRVAYAHEYTMWEYVHIKPGEALMAHLALVVHIMTDEINPMVLGLMHIVGLGLYDEFNVECRRVLTAYARGWLDCASRDGATRR